MFLRGRAGNVGPKSPEPFGVIFLIDLGESALFQGRLAVGTRLAEHQNVLNIVLDDGVRFIRLT